MNETRHGPAIRVPQSIIDQINIAMYRERLNQLKTPPAEGERRCKECLKCKPIDKFAIGVNVCKACRKIMIKHKNFIKYGVPR